LNAIETALADAKNAVENAEKEEKPERNLLPGGWFNLIAILGMI
jgi:hypothetical protein